MISKDEDVAAAIERVDAACASGAGDRGAEHEADGDGWVHRAAFRMLLDDVAESRVVEALDEVAAQVTASGERPRELFGDPDAWVAERRARWREAGAEHVVRPRPHPLDLLGESLLIAAIISGMLLLYKLITLSWSDPFSLGILLFPVLIGFISRAVQLVHTEVRSARSQRLGMLAAAVTTAVGVAAAIGIIVPTRDIELGGPPALWLFGLAVVCAGLGVVLAVVAPERPGRPLAAPLDEEQWFDALASALREREDMTDARVGEIVAESRAHAREAGASPQEEFGAPRVYAERFSGNPRLVDRRKAWVSTVLALLALVYVVASAADGTLNVWGVLWLLLGTSLAVLAWRDARRA